MILFFDKCVGRTVPELLTGCDMDVVWHDHHFSEGTEDDELLGEAGKRRWVFLTCDEGMIQRANQRQAIADYQVRCFVLWKAASRSPWHKIRIIARHWDTIREKVSGRRRALLYRLSLKSYREEKLPRPTGRGVE